MTRVATILAVTWVALLLVGQPVAAFLGRDKLEKAPGSRQRQYVSSAVGITMIGVVSLALDLATRRAALAAITVRLAPDRLALWVGGTLTACALYWGGSLYLRKIRGVPPAPGVLHLLPRTRSETAAFLGVAALAGTCEEFAIRGLCLFELQHLTGSLALAAVVTTVAFGLGHAYQGAGGVLRTTLVGAILVVPVLGSGSLIPSMIGHAAVDGMTGLWTYRLVRRWGLVSGDGEECGVGVGS